MGVFSVDVGTFTPTTVVFVVIPLLLGVLLLISGLAMWLWNITIPELFGVPPVGFWQMLRLIILLNILVGGTAITFNVVSSG